MRPRGPGGGAVLHARNSDPEAKPWALVVTKNED